MKGKAGDREIVLASEETTRRNVQCAVDFSNETRRMFTELKKDVDRLQNIVISRDQDMAMLKQQLSVVQAKLFSGGTS